MSFFEFPVEHYLGLNPLMTLLNTSEPNRPAVLQYGDTSYISLNYSEPWQGLNYRRIEVLWVGLPKMLRSRGYFSELVQALMDRYQVGEVRLSRVPFGKFRLHLLQSKNWTREWHNAFVYRNKNV